MPINHPVLLLLACALGAAPAAARAADVPGNASTKATLKVTAAEQKGTFEYQGDDDWYRVTLKMGQDYGIAGIGFYEDGADEPVFPVYTLRDGKGKKIASARQTFPDEVEGIEFRPKASGTYFVEFTAKTLPKVPNDYAILVSPDCREDETTTCSLAVGKTQKRTFFYSNDRDWFRTSLVQGKSYTVSVNDYACLSVADASGKTVAEAECGENELAFTPKKSGTYFVIAGNDDDAVSSGASYQLKLSTP